MFGDRQSTTDLDEVPEVEVAARRGVSIVWLIPLVAGAIAIWLGYTTLQQKGPTVTITFANAEGLEAGKTKVKYKDVEVGLVEEVRAEQAIAARVAPELDAARDLGVQLVLGHVRVVPAVFRDHAAIPLGGGVDDLVDRVAFVVGAAADDRHQGVSSYG